MAEIAQRREDEARAQYQDERTDGVQAVTGQGELLRRRAQRETDRKAGSAARAVEKGAAAGTGERVGPSERVTTDDGKK